MPLSEEELRLLEQMERALVQEDPKLASTLRGTTLRQSARRRAILAGVVFAVGVAVLIAGAYFTLTILGIAGFVIMLGSATMALTSLRGSSGGPRASRPAPPSPPARAASPSSRAAGPSGVRRGCAATRRLLRLLHGADGRAVAPSSRRARRLLTRPAL